MSLKLDLKPLRHRAFRRLLAAEIVNIAGDWLGLIALTVLVYDRTGKSLAMALLFISMRFLPALVGLPLVARLEGLPARLSLPMIYLGEMVLLVLLALQVDNFFLPIVALLAFLDGSLAISGRALIRSSTAAVLKPTGDLQQGNALLNVVFTWGFFISPALAGVIVAAVGIRDALLIDAATFLVAALTILGARGLPEGVPEARAWWRRLKQGLSYARDYSSLNALLVGTGIVVAVTDIIYPIEVILVKSTFNGGDEGYGFFLAAWGAGMALGGLWFALRRPSRLPKLLLLSVILMGAALAGIALAPNLIVASSILAIGGLGNGFQVVALFTLVQEMIDDTFQARIVSLLNTVMELMPGIGFLIGGILGAFVSPKAVFLIAGIGTLLVAAGLFAKMRNIRWPERAMEPALGLTSGAVGKTGKCGAEEEPTPPN